MTIKELIKKLKKLEKKHGNKEIDIYKSFNKDFTSIDEQNIYYDKELNTFSIGIYS